MCWLAWFYTCGTVFMLSPSACMYELNFLIWYEMLIWHLCRKERHCFGIDKFQHVRQIFPIIPITKYHVTCQVSPYTPPAFRSPLLKMTNSWLLIVLHPHCFPQPHCNEFYYPKSQSQIAISSTTLNPTVSLQLVSLQWFTMSHFC